MIQVYKTDSQGNPVQVPYCEYEAWHEAIPEEHSTGVGYTVARDEEGEVTVSTVFLNIDHGYGSDKPALWETMVFGGQHDQDCERYSSQVEAVEGHQAACLKYLGRPSECEGYHPT